MNASEFILHLFCTEVPFCDASSDVDLMSILNKLVCLEDILLKSDFSFEGACLKEKTSYLVDLFDLVDHGFNRVVDF
jgi:hypothetical protein